MKSILLIIISISIFNTSIAAENENVGYIKPAINFNGNLMTTLLEVRCNTGKIFITTKEDLVDNCNLMCKGEN